MTVGMPRVVIASLLGVVLADLYVDPQAGKDSNGGRSQARALKTVGAAMKKLARIQGDVTVRLGSGDHDFSKSALNFASGVAGRTITLQGSLDISGAHTARLLGGKVITHRRLNRAADSDVWALVPSAARSQIRVADVSSFKENFGSTQAMSSVEGEPEEFVPSAAGDIESAFPMEPFLDGRPLTTAQWPNRDDPDTTLKNNQTDYRFTRVTGEAESTYEAYTSNAKVRKYRFAFMQDAKRYPGGVAPFAGWTDW